MVCLGTQRDNGLISASPQMQRVGMIVHPILKAGRVDSRDWVITHVAIKVTASPIETDGVFRNPTSDARVVHFSSFHVIDGISNTRACLLTRVARIQTRVLRSMLARN